MGLVPPHGVETLMMTSPASEEAPNQVLEWNQIFIDTLIVTNTANSSSQRLGAIVHTAVFDAYNGIVPRYTPIFVQPAAPPGASRRAAVIAAAHTALVGLFPARQAALDASYAASLAALSDDGGDGGQIARARHRVGHPRRGVGARVASERRVRRDLSRLHRRTRDRPMAPDPPGLRSDERAGAGVHRHVRAGRQHSVPASTAKRTRAPAPTRTISTPSRRSAAARDRRARPISHYSPCSGKGTRAFIGIRRPIRSRARTTCRCRESNRLLAMLNIAMADTAFTTWRGKRFYGANPTEVTWRPVTAIPLADSDGNPDTVADPPGYP